MPNRGGSRRRNRSRSRKRWPSRMTKSRTRSRSTLARRSAPPSHPPSPRSLHAPRRARAPLAHAAVLRRVERSRFDAGADTHDAVAVGHGDRPRGRGDALRASDGGAGVERARGCGRGGCGRRPRVRAPAHEGHSDRPRARRQGDRRRVRRARQHRTSRRDPAAERRRLRARGVDRRVLAERSPGPRRRPRRPPRPPARPSPPRPPPRARWRPLSSVASGADDCAFGHRGVLLDLGDPATRARASPPSDSGRIDSVERDGASWARIFARGVTIPFVATADDVAAAPRTARLPSIEARVRGGSARSIAVFLNGKAAGVWPLVKGEAQSSRSARQRGAGRPIGAEVGTVHTRIARSSSPVRTSSSSASAAPRRRARAPPTKRRRSTGSTSAGPSRRGLLRARPAPTRSRASTLGGVPMRAVSLRAPGYARCTGWLPAEREARRRPSASPGRVTPISSCGSSAIALRPWCSPRSTSRATPRGGRRPPARGARRRGRGQGRDPRRDRARRRPLDARRARALRRAAGHRRRRRSAVRCRRSRA